MKFDFIKNRVLFLSICIFLFTVLVLLSVWKQHIKTVEGMVVMDFLNSGQVVPKEELTEGDDALPRITDMDLRDFTSALIPFEKKFETDKKADDSIKDYKKGFVYDPSNNELGDMNMTGISLDNLEKYINHLKNTSDSFKKFYERLEVMKKEKINEYTMKKQATLAAPT